MIMSNSIDENWVTSKEILLKTGISRATLNNYIKMGIIQRPIVKKPMSDGNKAKKIGYFPGETEEIINVVKSLKREGNSMEEIARKIKNMKLVSQSGQNGDAENDYQERRDVSLSDRGRRSGKILDKDLKLTIDDIGSSAYLVNRNFEIEWINNEAEEEMFNMDITITT